MVHPAPAARPAVARARAVPSAPALLLALLLAAAHRCGAATTLSAQWLGSALDLAVRGDVLLDTSAGGGHGATLMGTTYTALAADVGFSTARLSMNPPGSHATTLPSGTGGQMWSSGVDCVKVGGPIPVHTWGGETRMAWIKMSPERDTGAILSMEDGRASSMCVAAWAGCLRMPKCVWSASPGLAA